MRVVQIGNHGPPHSTETHLRRALTAVGHEVVPVQESRVSYRRATQLATGRPRADLVLWTHTHGLGPESTHSEQTLMIDRLRRSGIPIVSYHLDRWWGLDREEQVRTEPFFRTDLVCTPDGGAPWDEIGVEHAWFPPAVLGSECELGTPRDEYRSELAFVGSWQHGYHAEWRHRPELVRFLRDRYGDRCRFWPRPNEHAVRGEDLRDLYASVEVIVGDSCLVPYATGDPVSGYCSDRVPETLGRGGCLIHPYALNVIGRQGEPGLWEDGLHLYAWPVGEWDDLAWHIDRLLDEPVIREGLREYGRAHTLQHHTYERRMVELEGLLVDRGLVAVA